MGVELLRRDLEPMALSVQSTRSTHKAIMAVTRQQFSPPEVSVIMASYNHAHFIASAIESVLAQSMSSWELIIVDDGSTDSSQDVICQYTEKDSRLRFFQHPYDQNLGLPATLDLGLQSARGQYVAFLESDDEWRVDCLEKRLQRLRESGADVVLNHIEIVEDKAGKTGDLYLVEGIRKHLKRYQTIFYLWEKLHFINVIPTFSCIMLKREALAKVDLIPPVSRWLDWWLWLQVSEIACFTYMDVRCTVWRRHRRSYNRRRDVRAYIKDSKAMWRAMRHFAPKWREKPPCGLWLFLSLPFSFYLLVRLAHMTRINGLLGLIRRTLSKFTPI